jgi:hypothetical protein
MRQATGDGEPRRRNKRLNRLLFVLALLIGFVLKRSLQLALVADEKLRHFNQMQNLAENSMPELEAPASLLNRTAANSRPMVVPKGLPVVAGDVVDEAAKRYPENLTSVANEELGQLDQLQNRAHDSFSLLQLAAAHSNSTRSPNQNFNETKTGDATVGSITTLKYLPPLDDIVDAISSNSNLTAGQVALDANSHF